MKTLYLHIGTPKTGTSAIQIFCSDNQDALKEHGYYYPIFDFKYFNVKKVRNAHFLLGETRRKREERNFDAEEQEIKEGFEQIYEAFETYDNIILSDESVWNYGFDLEGRCWNKIQEELKKKIFVVKVIVYLRRQDEFMYSWWNQMVKEGMKNSSLLSWEEMVEKRPVVQLDYYEKLQKIAAVVGKENITVRRFSRNSFVGQMIEADFLDSVGLEFSEEYQVRQQLTNSSLTKNCNEIKRILNHFSGGGKMERKRTICFGIA